MSLSENPEVRPLLAAARREDFGTGDATSALLPDPGAAASFRLLARQPGVLAGCEIAEAVLQMYDEALVLRWREGMVDGAKFSRSPTELAVIDGSLAAGLAVERVLLNFLQRLCGIATLTRRFVDAVAETGVDILDTRKTTPGWRVLEKYAVRCGGGRNHREGLFDAVLIKDNHLAGVPVSRLAATVFEMLNRVPSDPKPRFVEVEADSVDQVRELFKVVGIDAILLDNFSLTDLRRAVQMREEFDHGGKIKLEASGGVTLETVRAIAETGVDRISVGAITHSAAALDLSVERIA